MKRADLQPIYTVRHKNKGFLSFEWVFLNRVERKPKTSHIEAKYPEALGVGLEHGYAKIWWISGRLYLFFALFEAIHWRDGPHFAELKLMIPHSSSG
jgi:hypothetical protein